MTAALDVTCPRCLAPPGRACSKGIFAYVPTRRPHYERIRLAKADDR